MKSIDLHQKFSKIDKTWTPYIVAEVNQQHVKLARLSGEFMWHTHELEDELFFVHKGELYIELDSETIHLRAGQMYVVTKGTPHRPYTGPDGAEVMLFEPATIQHTGEKKTHRTVENPEWL